MTNKLNFALSWMGCFFVASGALTTSLRIDPLNIYLLNFGALFYLIWSIRVKERSLIVTNGVLLALYIIGIFYQ